MKRPLFLGYDVGSSFVKSSLIDAETGQLVAAGQSPEQEMRIDAPQIGWAEQHPEMWWENVVLATKKMLMKVSIDNPDVRAIGISYQMHGLVLIDQDYKVLCPAIIWCDSRAVGIGRKAYAELGPDYCLDHYLNPPGNFTASKLKWVEQNQPDVYQKVFKIMLPGDYIAFKMTGRACTTVSGMSEGILWDFKKDDIAGRLMDYYHIEQGLIPDIVPTFGVQGTLDEGTAKLLGLNPGTPITYRAGDQPNSAFSLNVLSPGEVAATAGTSGVIYGVTKENISDSRGRINTFAHVNYSAETPNKGVLLCINGTGIQYSWLKKAILDNRYSYDEMNTMADRVNIGSDGVMCFPYGNGSERMLENKDVTCRFLGISFNIHEKAHLIRAAQEGIAFSFRYGLDILKSLGLVVQIVRAGDSNLFRSNVFKEAFVNTCNVDLEIYNTDGAQGAARGAGIGAKWFSGASAFQGIKAVEHIHPVSGLSEEYESAYTKWKETLVQFV